jgi:hypothetical protein
MANWIARPGGRLVRFRNQQVRHWCSRRKKGRPVVGNGPCHPIDRARAVRRQLAAQLRRQLREQPELLDDVVHVPATLTVLAIAFWLGAVASMHVVELIETIQ